MGATRKDSSNLLEKMGYGPKGVKSFKVTGGGKVTVRYYLDPDNKDAGYKEDTFRLPKPLPPLPKLSAGSTVYTTAEVKALPVGSVLEHGWSPGNVERGWVKAAENQWTADSSSYYADVELARAMGRKVLRVGPAVKPGSKVGDKVYDAAGLPVGTTLWPDSGSHRWWLVKGADGKLRDSDNAGLFDSYNSTGRVIRSLPPKVGDAITSVEQAAALPVGASVFYDGDCGLVSGWWRKTEPDRWVAYSRDGSLSGVLRNHTDASLIAAREGLTPRRLRSLGA